MAVILDSLLLYHLGGWLLGKGGMIKKKKKFKFSLSFYLFRLLIDNHQGPAGMEKCTELAIISKTSTIYMY